MVRVARVVRMVMKARLVRQDVQEAVVVRLRRQEKYDDMMRSR